MSRSGATTSDTNAVLGRYVPALDGVRALAVAAVVAYHLGFGWASGGYLGVDLFFVLSGFLITSLLVEEWSSTGTIRLGRFWEHRARRLLPALLLMLVAVCIYSSLASSGLPVDFGQLRGDALATLGYAANWYQIAAHQSYFDRFSLPSPLKHTWSLAIEEQFYLLWPLVIVALMRLTARAGLRRRHGPAPPSSVGGPGAPWRRAGLLLTASGAMASAAWRSYLSSAGASVNRLYYGTDTRAFDLLVGATLAMIVANRPQPAAAARRLLAAASPIALVVLALCWVTAGLADGDPRRWMFEGGFLLCAVAAAVLLADVRQAVPGPVARALSLRPIRFLGQISYGIYLWHWPVIVELTTTRSGLSGLSLDALRVAVIVSLAVASYFLVERPIRRGVLGRLPAALRRAVAPVTMALTAGVIVISTLPVAAQAVPAPAVRVTIPPPPAADGHQSKGNVNAGSAIIGQPIRLGTVPTRKHPVRVLLIGDSVMLSDSPAVQALLQSTGAATVVNQSQWGWGLTTAQGGWRNEIARWVAASTPQLVIGMWSWDNGLAWEHPAAYRAELASMVREMLGLGVRGVILQQYPEPGPDVSAGGDAPARAIAEIVNWERIAASLTSAFPGRVVYLPIGGSVLLHGRFSDWLPPEGDPTAPQRMWERVRMTDNVHLCPAGAARYAAALYSDLRSFIPLPSPSATWWSGAWRLDYVPYRYPTATVCPNDHP
jgi:peptidoglycan/LPS O-acetylase OafA/YrhL